MNAYLLSLNEEASVSKQWDFGFIKDLLIELGAEIKEVDKLTKDSKAVVVIPARHHKGLEIEINTELKKILNPVLICIGDEEADFDITKIELKPERIYIQNPHKGMHDLYNKFGTGYPPHMKQYLPKDAPIKDLNVFFAGQVTHKRREKLADVLLAYWELDQSTRITRTKGFTQGLEHKDYYNYMLSAKIAPCPSGAVIPDSFRLFEALECMAIPLADQKTPKDEIIEYWDWLFQEEAPFPKIVEWDRLFGLIPELLEDYPRNVHQITAFYIKWKRNFKNKLRSQLDV